MNCRRLGLVAALTPLFAFAQSQVAPKTAMATSKSAKNWTVPRTADGHPDFQAVWVNNSATPLERPKELADRDHLTDAEVQALRKKAAELYNGDGDTSFGDFYFETVWKALKSSTTGPHKIGDHEFDSGTGDYSSVWIVQRDWDNRTSLITDPPNGKLPPMTPEATKRRDAGLQASQHPADGPEDRGLSERCITYGTPQTIAGYQSYLQFVETPKSVMIETEMIHDARVIPMDGRPHVASGFHEWNGDSRGHWEGDTLVIDSTNYKPRAFMSMSSDKLHVIERFTRTSQDVLKYEITVDDPGTWTKPWTMMIPLRLSDHEIYEYACHEGNIGLAGILAGARADEKKAAAAAGGTK